MAHYYLSSSKSAGGNGLTAETAFKYSTDLRAALLTSGHTVHIEGGVEHHPDPALGFPSLTSTISHRVLDLAASNTTFTVDGDGPGILTGCVAFDEVDGTSVSDVVVNGINCKVLDAGREVSPFWFPRIAGKRTYPAYCAPGPTDDVDSFPGNPAAFDIIQDGVKGYRFVPASAYGGTLDSTKEVSYADLGSGAGAYRYRFKIRRGPWLARVNAVRAIKVGPPPPLMPGSSTAHQVGAGELFILRTGANFTTYDGWVESYVPYDAGDPDNPDKGCVYIRSRTAPSGGTSGGFFYSLYGHPYGLRKNRQFAINGDNTGWIVTGIGPGDAVDIACWGTAVRLTGSNVVFDQSKDFEFRGLANHAADRSRAGFGVLLDGNFSVFRGGASLTLRQAFNPVRDGGPLGLISSGSITDVEADGLASYDCTATKMLEVACGSSGDAEAGSMWFRGPIYSDEGGAGIRVSGRGRGIIIEDFVITPRALIHDNMLNVYGFYKGVWVRNGVCTGGIPVFATQWHGSPTALAANPAVDVDRQFINLFFCARPNLTLTGYQGNALRHDNGNTNGLYDRVIGVNGICSFSDNSNPATANTGMEVKRSVLQWASPVGGDDGTDPLAGMSFEDVVFLGRTSNFPGSQPSVEAWVVANGATSTDAAETAADETFHGVLTPAMHEKLTRNAAGDGYEPISPWLAPQLGLTLRAYDDVDYPIQRPADVGGPLREGHGANVLLKQFIGPNVGATMALVPGYGDNDKFTLFDGFNLVAAEEWPAQAVCNVRLRVTDPSANNGPYQDFDYQWQAELWGALSGAPDPVEEPPPSPPTTFRGSRAKLKLRGRLIAA